MRNNATLILFWTDTHSEHTGRPLFLFCHNGISGVIPPLLLSGRTTNPLTIDSTEYWMDWRGQEEEKREGLKGEK